LLLPIAKNAESIVWVPTSTEILTQKGFLMRPGQASGQSIEQAGDRASTGLKHGAPQLR